MSEINKVQLHCNILESYICVHLFYRMGTNASVGILSQPSFAKLKDELRDGKRQDCGVPCAGDQGQCVEHLVEYRFTSELYNVFRK